MPAPSRLLRISDVTALTGTSRSWIYRAVTKEIFPKPRKLSPHTRRVGWNAAEVEEWISSRHAA